MIPTFASFFLRDGRRHHADELSDLSCLPLTIRTAVEQWAYAVEWPRTPERSPTPLLITVTLRVSAGAIGVGILTPSGDAFVDHAIVDAAGHEQSIQLVAGRPDDLGSLVVRNGSADGASNATISHVDVSTFDEPADAPRPALAAVAPMRGWSRYYDLVGLTPIKRLRATRFQDLPGNTVLHWRDGLSFEVHPGDSLSRVVYVSGTYEPNTLCVLRALLRPGDVFIDVGGNAGIVSLAAAQWVGSTGHVHAFEPSGREYRRLVDTIARNHLSKVTAHRAALGARRGTAVLKVASSQDGGLNTLGRRFPYDHVALETLEDVEVRTLDEVVATEQVGPISAIKIDVEGMELHVLRGASEIIARDRPALVVEVFGRALEACGASPRALEEVLIAKGYVLWAIGDDGGLRRLRTLMEVDGQNIVALPDGRHLAVPGSRSA